MTAIDRWLDGLTIIKEQEKERCVVVPPQPRCVNTSAPPNPNPEEIFRTMVKGINLREILSDEILNGGYYTYDGSLTTPPCTNVVRWFVMKKTAIVSYAQLLRFQQITRPCNPESLQAPNWRRLQDNINPVFECNGKRKYGGYYTSVRDTYVQKPRRSTNNYY